MALVEWDPSWIKKSDLLNEDELRNNLDALVDAVDVINNDGK
jgi:hypothetical protein